MEGTRRVTLSIPGHVWDEHLQEVPTTAGLLLTFTEAPCSDKVTKGFFRVQRKTHTSPTHLPQ